jgi:hypothetical protein
MKAGDRIVVTETTESCLSVGDKATLTHQDGEGDWWADFDERCFFDGDNNMCLEVDFTDFELIEQSTI